MSGGQQQMLAIARALMSSPRCCWSMKPSSACRRCWSRRPSPRSASSIGNLGLTVLMAEQNFNQAIRIASRGYIIRARRESSSRPRRR
jgi:branched-chain amino acid transport system ATP-binding protein